MSSTLASVLVPIGIAGAVFAAVCALVVTIAIARGAAGLAGGAAGVWIVGAMLSITASFAMLWMPFIIAAGSLGAALVLGLVLRGVVLKVRARRRVVVEPAEPVEQRSTSTARDLAVA